MIAQTQFGPVRVSTHAIDRFVLRTRAVDRDRAVQEIAHIFGGAQLRRRLPRWAVRPRWEARVRPVGVVIGRIWRPAAWPGWEQRLVVGFPIVRDARGHAAVTCMVKPEPRKRYTDPTGERLTPPS